MFSSTTRLVEDRMNGSNSPHLSHDLIISRAYALQVCAFLQGLQESWYRPLSKPE